MPRDIPKKNFLKWWGPGGYQQVFDAGYNYEWAIRGALDEEAVKRPVGSRCLEIGCGNGFWTNEFLSHWFRNIVCVDLVKKPSFLKSTVEYHRLKSRDFSLSCIEDNSIDFVWSFGVFCHFTNRAVETYLKSVHRVMKPGGTAIIMFANWKTHPDFKDQPAVYGVDPNPFCGWTCTNIANTRIQIEAAGLVFVRDAIEDFRDSLVVIEKR